MIFWIPLNMLIALILKKTQEQQMKNWDSQTRVMSELLANIKRPQNVSKDCYCHGAEHNALG